MKKILHHGKVYVEKGVFAEAVMIEGGLIAAVGSNEDILSLADGETELLDCGGKTLIPGLNDSHLHFMQFGETLNQVDIDGVPSIDEMIRRCRDFIDKYPEKVKDGLHAIGWNQDLFVDSDRLPDRHDLDQISRGDSHRLGASLRTHRLFQYKGHRDAGHRRRFAPVS